MGAVTVNPVRTSQYDLTAGANPITFGTGTNIDVSSGDAVVGGTTASWTVINEGSLQAGVGVDLASQSTLTNAGSISGTGSYGYGALLDGGGSVANQNGGKISGGFAGVGLNASGAVTNQNGGTISGGFAGVLAGAGTVTNGGTINAAATVTNAGTISGEQGVAGVALLNGGAVTNQSGGQITGGYRGVWLETGGTVTNQAGGTISGTGLNADGVYIYGGTGSVTNAGTIAATYRGVQVGAGCTVTNQAGGTISGTGSNADGVYIYGSAGTVTNAGTISGTATSGKGNIGGVWLDGSGTVTNQAGGTISGTGPNADGVYIGGGAGTVTNAGTISGTSASVVFAGTGANTLTLQTGSVLASDAIGSTASGATNALVLQGSGEADNNFVDFNTLNVQASGTWTLGGVSTIGATTVSDGTLIVTGALTGALTITGGGIAEFNADFQGNATFQDAGTLALAQAYGGTIAGFGLGDTIDLSTIAYNTSFGAVWYAGANGGTLQIIDSANSDSIATTLNFAGSVSGEAFTLGSDGAVGLDIALSAVPGLTPAAGDVVFSIISDQPYEVLYNGGVYAGIDYFFTNVAGQAYSSYEYIYSSGNDLIGSKFFYTDVTGEPYTGNEYDYDGGGNVTRVDYTGVTGTGYSSYEYDFVGGVFAGSKFEVTSVPTGATYSSYELDYNSASAFTGDEFFFTNLPGQSYSGEEEDFDANGALTRVLLTGVTGQSYSSLEEDYSGGTYTGYKAFYTGITGQTYTSEEVDVSAADQLTKVIYTGMAGTPYSSVEQDYGAGVLTGEIYDFTNVSGASYYAYQVEDNAGGTAQQEILDNNDGSHTIIGLGAADQTFTSIADDTFTGGGASETFVFTPIYGSDTITDFYQYSSGATHDTISLATSEFANFAAVTAAAANVGSNVIIKAADGDTLTLAGLSTMTLAGLSADFTFHA